MSSKKKIAEQIAALPIRWDKNGKLRILMVTSRETRRWVMPKGWLMDGKKPWRAAEIEALEEAGAVGEMWPKPIGTYHYDKRLPRGASIRCRVTVYPMAVDRLQERWKERRERTRRWLSPKKAAKLVDEKELSKLLLGLANDAKPAPIIEAMREAS